jgi:AraC-like DNA-binding protein
LTIQNFIPSPRLQPYIQQYYLAEGDFAQKTQDVFFADGCLEVVFNLDLDFYRDNQKEPWAKLIGQITRPLHVAAKGTGKSFGIWFSPQGFSFFSQIPVREFNDQAIALEAIFDRAFIDIVGSKLAVHDIEGLIGHINGYFEKLLEAPEANLKEQVADHAVKRLIRSGVELELNELARECNVSNRYLQKILADKVGFGPKKLQRILRFQQALNQLNSSSASSLTAIAYDSGYSDQSHFIREFRAFTGFAPSAYQHFSHPINQYSLGS